MSVKLTTATVRWIRHPTINDSRLNATTYNISLISGNQYHEHFVLYMYDQFDFTFSNLTMGKEYTVKVQTLDNIGHLEIGAVVLFSPGK